MMIKPLNGYYMHAHVHVSSGSSLHERHVRILIDYRLLTLGLIIVYYTIT